MYKERKSLSSVLVRVSSLYQGSKGAYTIKERTGSHLVGNHCVTHVCDKKLSEIERSCNTVRARKEGANRMVLKNVNFWFLFVSGADPLAQHSILK